MYITKQLTCMEIKNISMCGKSAGYENVLISGNNICIKHMILFSILNTWNN